jgi:hypothetical protein
MLGNYPELARFYALVSKMIEDRYSMR